MLAYLEAVVAGKLPVNNEIVALLQDMFNLLPNLNIDALAQSLTGAPAVRLRCTCTAASCKVNGRPARSCATRAAAGCKVRARLVKAILQ
jgi:Maintenance of mitochondrial structure and function